MQASVCLVSQNAIVAYFAVALIDLYNCLHFSICSVMMNPAIEHSLLSSPLLDGCIISLPFPPHLTHLTHPPTLALGAVLDTPANAQCCVRKVSSCAWPFPPTSLSLPAACSGCTQGWC